MGDLLSDLVESIEKEIDMDAEDWQYWREEGLPLIICDQMTGDSGHPFVDESEIDDLVRAGIAMLPPTAPAVSSRTNFLALLDILLSDAFKKKHLTEMFANPPEGFNQTGDWKDPYDLKEELDLSDEAIGLPPHSKWLKYLLLTKGPWSAFTDYECWHDAMSQWWDILREIKSAILKARVDPAPQSSKLSLVQLVDKALAGTASDQDWRGWVSRPSGLATAIDDKLPEPDSEAIFFIEPKKLEALLQKASDSVTGDAKDAVGRQFTIQVLKKLATAEMQEEMLKQSTLGKQPEHCFTGVFEESGAFWEPDHDESDHDGELPYLEDTNHFSNSDDDLTWELNNHWKLIRYENFWKGGGREGEAMTREYSRWLRNQFLLTRAWQQGLKELLALVERADPELSAEERQHMTATGRLALLNSTLSVYGHQVGASYPNFVGDSTIAGLSVAGMQAQLAKAVDTYIYNRCDLMSASITIVPELQRFKTDVSQKEMRFEARNGKQRKALHVSAAFLGLVSKTIEPPKKKEQKRSKSPQDERKDLIVSKKPATSPAV